MQSKQDRKIVFRRIGGRVIPISVATTGGLVALDAARTQVVRQTKNSTIVRKKFSLLPQSLLNKRIEFGTSLHSYTNRGTKTGHAFLAVDVENGKKWGSFDWLSVKKQYRGKGISKDLAKQGALELKSLGAKTIDNQVVHLNSANLFSSKSVNKYYKVGATDKLGYAWETSISKKEAFKQIGKYRKYALDKGPKVYKEPFKWLSYKKVGKEPASVFRSTKIPDNIRRLHQPFRTTANKIKIGLGIAALVGGIAAYRFLNKKKDQK